MKREQFILEVRALTSISDYLENNHLLDVVDSLHFEPFLNCLKMGSSIKPSFKALDILNELTKKTALGSDDILDLLPRFMELICIFDNSVHSFRGTELPFKAD